MVFGYILVMPRFVKGRRQKPQRQKPQRQKPQRQKPPDDKSPQTTKAPRRQKPQMTKAPDDKSPRRQKPQAIKAPDDKSLNHNFFSLSHKKIAEKILTKFRNTNQYLTRTTALEVRITSQVQRATDLQQRSRKNSELILKD